jgi:hypothetical protein
MGDYGRFEDLVECVRFQRLEGLELMLLDGYSLIVQS